MSEYYFTKDELYHHGILGQKWGKTNGPPYPLGSDKHSKSEQKAGWRKSLGGGRNEELYGRKKTLSDSQKKKIKKALIVGAAVGATALTVGVLYKSGYLEKGKNKIEEFVTSIGQKPLSSYSEEERQNLINPNFGSSLGTMMNCGCCVLADEAQERGIDVIARGNETGMTLGDLIAHYENMPSQNVLVPDANALHDIGDYDPIEKMLDYKKGLLERGEKVQSMLVNQIKTNFPDGSRGCFLMPNVNGTHWMSWKMVDGKVKIKNPQYPKFVKDSAELKRYFGGYVYHKNVPDAALTIIRTDNVPFTNRLYDAVIQRSRKRYNSSYYDSWRVEGENFVIRTLKHYLS